MLPKNLRSLWVDSSPDKAVARARRFVEKGRYDSAAAALKDALEARGEDSDMRLELSQILVSAGRTREAADGLRTFLKAKPGEFPRVRDFVEWARAHHSEVQPLHEVLGEHHVSRKEWSAALEELERVDKQALQALLEARLANLNRFLEKGPGAVPKSAVPLLYFAALIYEALQDYPKAAETYRRIVSSSASEVKAVEERFKAIVARNHRSTALRAALAEIYLGAGEEARALDEYVLMAEIDPRAAPQAAAALEGIAASAADPSEALWALARVRGKEGKVEDLLRVAGRLIAMSRRLDEVRGLLEGAIADGKQDPRLQLLIGEAALGAGKVSHATSAFAAAAMHPAPEIRSRAREALERTAAAHPTDAKASEALADHHLREGRFDDCVAALEGLCGIEAGAAPMVVSRLQTLLLSRPGHPSAETLLERLAPVSGNTRLAAAFFRRRLRGAADEARASLEALTPMLEKDPQDSEVRLAAAEARAACGDIEGAWAFARPLVDATMGPDPTLLHLMVLIGGSSPERCHEVSEVFRNMAPALAAAPEGVFALGEMAARNGDTTEALSAFRAAAAFSPAAAAEVIDAVRGLGGGGLFGEAAVSLGEALLDAGDFAGAASVLSTATQLPPSAMRLMSKLEEALRSRPENLDLRVALASALVAGGRASRGREVIEEGIRRGGDSAQAPLHLAAGDAWLREGNLGEAVRAYSRAMARDKSLASDAAHRIEKVLDTDVGHAGAHLALGRARLLEGRPREGVNSLLTSWSIRPALGASILKDLAYAAHAFPLEPQVDLSRAQILLGQGEVEKATEALGAALRTAPSIAVEVLVRLQSITRSHPSCARAHLHAARAWHQRGRCAESSASYAAAVEHDPNLAEMVAAGLADLMRTFPESTDPFLVRARIYESQGNPGPAAESYHAAAARGCPPGEILPALRALALRPGPHRGRALIALGCVARDGAEPSEAARAFEMAALDSPDLLGTVREEIDALVESHPRCSEALQARARVALAALDAASALSDAERLLETDPARWHEVAALTSEVAGAGGDKPRCAWVGARALTAGGDFDAAARLLDEGIGSCDGELRASLCLLRARVERRRGDPAAAKAWVSRAREVAADAGTFLTALHAETVAAARGAATKTQAVSDRWRALQACLDLGDADRAEAIAADLGLGRPDGAAGAPPEPGAAEALAKIACLRGRYAEASELLGSAPPSALRAYALKRAGRLLEAAACLAAMEPSGTGAAKAARDIYRLLAAEEFLGEPTALEAETRLAFSTGEKEGDRT